MALTHASAMAGVPKPGTNTKKHTYRRGTQEETRWVKILGYGHSGSGKTLFIIGLLQSGLKVAVLSTDFGGSGLQTIYQYFEDHLEESHLLANLIEIELTSWNDVDEWTKNPWADKEILDFNPDILVWDGFSSFQQVVVAQHISDEQEARARKAADSGKSSPLSESGLQFDQQDWGKIRNATLWPLNNFLRAQPPGEKRVHKYVTAQEDSEKEDKLTKEVLRAPLIQGASRTLLSAAFDVIMRFRYVKPPGSNDKAKRRYVYVCDGPENVLTKTRGFSLEPEEAAEPLRVWQKIAARLVKKTKT